MKSEAFFLEKFGKSTEVFSLKPFQIPEAAEDELTIEVEAFGLNYADVMARHGKYREAPPLPCVLGYEAVGKVIKSKDESWLGKRVLAFTRFGAYAKHVHAKTQACVEIGDMESEFALPLATQYVTAYYMAMYLSPLRKDDSVLIHAAAGGVGTALIQFAQLVGADIVAKVSSQEKVDFIKSLGVEKVINYKTHLYEEECKKMFPKGVTAIFNPVAGSTFKKDLKLLAPGGRLFMYGGSELLEGKWGILSTLNFVRKMGFMPPVGYMMQSKSLLGINMLKIADENPTLLNHCLTKVVRLFKEEKIRVSKGNMFSEAEMFQAHDLLESGKSIGKIGIRWQNS